MLVQPARHETLTKADIKRLRKTAPKQPVTAKPQNMQKAKRTVPIGRPFPKGVSGNPGGQPKDDVSVLARLYTHEALAALVNCLSVEKYAVAAAVAILDRGYGKPQQTTETNVNVNIDPKALTDEALARLIGSQPKLVSPFVSDERNAPATPMRHGDVTDVETADASKG